MIELEDLEWFPRAIRDLATDYLQFIETQFALHKPMVPLLREILAESGTAHVVDLCSGAAGPVLAVYESLIAEGIPVQFTLTDKTTGQVHQTARHARLRGRHNYPADLPFLIVNGHHFPSGGPSFRSECFPERRFENMSASPHFEFRTSD
jgi:hypothetical protein